MTFHIITIFPESFQSYIDTSILERSLKLGKIKIYFYNPRDFTKDKHRQVDDRPYGGGAGMLLKAEPILKAVSTIKSKIRSQKSKIVVLSAKGKQFDQKTALNYAGKLKHLIIIAGRYEGMDERIRIALKAEEISIGPYVLTDGELPAMVLVSSVARLLPGVIKPASLTDESFFEGKKEQKGCVEYPHYTRPEIIKFAGKNFRVPKVLLSGDHEKIEKWREENKT